MTRTHSYPIPSYRRLKPRPYTRVHQGFVFEDTGPPPQTVDLAGTVTPAGNLVKQVNLVKVGTVTPAGALAKETQKPLSGLVTPVGAVLKQAQKVLAGLLGVKAFYHPRNVAVGMTTPDHVDYAITDLDYEVCLRMENWAALGQVVILGGQTSILANHGWALSINTNGDINLGTSTDGSTGSQITVTATNPGFAPGSTHTIHVTADVDDGAGNKDYRIYLDGVQAAQNNSAGTTSIFNSTEVLSTSNPVLALRGGHVYWAKLRASIGGAEIANPTAEQETLGATSFVDDAGRTWTFGAGGYVGRDLYGQLSTTRVILRSFEGAVTPVGTLVKSAFKALTGTVIPAGSLAKQDQKTLAGSTTPTGTLSKQASKVLGGTVTPTGVLTTAKVFLRVFAGTITPAGALLKQAAKSLAGTVTPSGAVARQDQKTLGGTTTPTGDLSRRTSKTLAGSVTPTGTLGTLRLIVKALAGTITPVGTLLKQGQKVLSGTVTPAGTVSKTVGKGLGGTVTPTGDLRKFVSKLLSGVVSFVGTLLAEIPSGIPLQLKLGELRRRFGAGDARRRYDAGDMERRYGTGDMTREP